MIVPREIWLRDRARRLDAARAGSLPPSGWRLPPDAHGVVLERLAALDRSAAAGWDRTDLRSGSDAARTPWEHAAAASGPGDGDVRTAVIARFTALGDRIDLIERQAWAACTYEPTDADADAEVLWTAAREGRLLSERDRIDLCWRPALFSVADAVLEDRGLPVDRAEGIVELVLRALCAPTPSGWAGLLARVVETTGPGPVRAVARALDRDAIDVLASCAAHHGAHADTVQQRYPNSFEADARARRLAHRWRDDPEDIHRDLELHVAQRVLDAWANGADDAVTWRLVRQQRGRARSRLRALYARNPGPVPADALAARTDAALRRHAWHLAQRALSQDADAPLVPFAPPCDAPPPAVLDEDVVRTWVLLALLRNRGGHLRRWVRTGGTGDQDSGWARLLSQALPARLVDPNIGERRTYHGLRGWLDLHLDAVVTSLVPELRAAVAMDRAGLRRRWHPDVPFPRTGFERMARAATAALESL